MCDLTQWLLCQSPIKIHKCIWIQWLILQNWPHATNWWHAKNKWLHSLSLKMQARQKDDRIEQFKCGLFFVLICLLFVLFWQEREKRLKHISRNKITLNLLGCANNFCTHPYHLIHLWCSGRTMFFTFFWFCYMKYMLYEIYIYAFCTRRCKHNKHTFSDFFSCWSICSGSQFMLSKFNLTLCI